MARNEDAKFDLLVAAPYAYRAHQKGFAAALAHGASPEQAARDCGLCPAEIAGALGVMKKARRKVRGAGNVVAKARRVAQRAHPLALTAAAAKRAGRGLAAATGGLRRKIFRAFFRKLIARRARLVSWQRRGSLAPAPGEMVLAQKWAVRYVKRRGIFGKLVGAALSGEVIGEAATATLVSASIPVLVALAKRALRSAERQGAPVDPRTQPAAEDTATDTEDL